MIMPIKNKFEDMLEEYICALVSVFQGRTDKPSYPYRNKLLDRDKAMVDFIQSIADCEYNCLNDLERTAAKFLEEVNK